MNYYCLIFIIVFASCQTIIKRNPPPKVVKGVLDLRNWDLQNDGSVKLNGEWEFYWKALYAFEDFVENVPSPSGYIDVPSAWNGFKVNNHKIVGEGYATYRLKILLNDASLPLALKINTIETAASIYVDGHLLEKTGKVGKEKEDMKPAYKPSAVTIPITDDELEVILHVSNYFHRKGGVWDSMLLGSEKNVMQSRFQSLGIEFFLAGSILVMAIYHLFLFFKRKKERYALYFGLFSLLVVIRIFFTGEYAANILWDFSWTTVIRMEYLSFYAGVPLFAAFFYNMFPSVISKKVVHLSYIIGGIFCLAVIILSPQLFTYTAVPYEIITLLFSLYGIYLLGVAIRSRLDGSYSFLVGFTALFVAIVNDVLYANELINTGYYLPLGLFGFMLAQTFSLSQRISSTFNNFENINVTLTGKNKKIEEQNSNLKRLNDERIFLYTEHLTTCVHP